MTHLQTSVSDGLFLPSGEQLLLRVRAEGRSLHKANAVLDLLINVSTLFTAQLKPTWNRTWIWLLGLARFSMRSLSGCMFFFDYKELLRYAASWAEIKLLTILIRKLKLFISQKVSSWLQCAWNTGKQKCWMKGDFTWPTWYANKLCYYLLCTSSGCFHRRNFLSVELCWLSGNV